MQTGKQEMNKETSARHLGSLIQELVKKSGLTAKQVAHHINVSDNQLNEIYGSPSVDIATLVKLSELLQYNLFIYYLDNSIVCGLFEQYTKDLAPQISYLIRHLEGKDDQIAQLRALTETQRKMIEILESSAFLQKRASGW